MKKSGTDVPMESISENKIVHVPPEKEVIEGPMVLPKKVPYLIVGGGAASWSAFRAIKKHVPNAKVH